MDYLHIMRLVNKLSSTLGALEFVHFKHEQSPSSISELWLKELSQKFTEDSNTLKSSMKLEGLELDIAYEQLKNRHPSSAYLAQLWYNNADMQ
jgi:hypothetical protein